MTTPKPQYQSAQGLLSPLLARWRLGKARPYVLNRRTLDYGCGNGGLARFCPADKYFGVDISPAAVDAARTLHPGYRFDTAPPQNQAYDVVVLLAVLEHIHEPAALMADLMNRLVPGGLLVATTPSPRARAVHDLGAALGLFSSEAAHEHEAFLSKRDIGAMVNQAGGRLVTFQRFMFGFNQFFVAQRVQERLT